MSRIGSRSTLLAIDDVDYTDDVSKAVIVTTEADAASRRFGEPDYDHGGMRSYRLALTLAQDSATTSLWGFAWENASARAAFYIAPHGNVTASAAEPHWSGEAWVSGPDGDLIGGEADQSPTAVLTSQMTWVIDGTPQRITSGTYPADPPEGW